MTQRRPRRCQDRTPPAGTERPSPTGRPARKPVDEMRPVELSNWLIDKTVFFSSFSNNVVEPYIERRARHGQQTPTDLLYEQFQREMADLLVGLDEWREQVEREAAKRKKQPTQDSDEE